MELPDAEERSKSKQDSIRTKKDKVNGQAWTRKRKKSTEETEEREEPGPSAFSNHNQKKPAKKDALSKFLVWFVLCLRVGNENVFFKNVKST